MKRIGIFGTSGFAREVADVAAALALEPLFIARDEDERRAWTFEGEVTLEEAVDTLGDIEFAIGIGDNAVRQRIAERHAGLRFPALVHPTASFGRLQRDAAIACDGLIVCAGVRFTNNIRIGRFSIFNLNATIGHDAEIGDFANVSPGANVSGNVVIGERCWVGTGAAINQGSGTGKLIIGADTVIGSGSVVVRDCEPSSIYVGIPARKIK